jgi:hypothetical protein
MKEFDTQIDLHSFDNFAGFNTARADFRASVAARRQLNADRLQIRIKTAACFVVRV